MHSHPQPGSTAARARGESGYGLVGYLVIAGVVLLIIAGGVLLVRLVVSSLSGPAAVQAASPAATTCVGATWFDPATASCVPKAVCRSDEVYDARTNTCAVPGPTITGIEPNSGLSTGGTAVRITGDAFAPDATVTIDGVAARDVVVVSPSTITATTAGSSNLYPVDVTVANPAGPPATLDNSFVYVKPAVDRVTAITPARGSKQGGEAVIIHGRQFTDGTKVAFGGRVSPSVQVLNATTLRVITPIGDGGPVSVNVEVPGTDVFIAEDAFTYVNAAPRVVMAIRPQEGAAAGGTKVTIVGTGFAKGAAVAIGGKPAREVKVVSDTRITAVTPKGALGKVNVAVRDPKLPAAILENGFEYVAAPQISGIRPARGPAAGGAKVTITGSGFAAGAEVSFGGQPATDVKVVSPTRITAVAPAGEPGPVAVVVTNPDEPAATLKKGFTYGPAQPAGPGPGEPTQPTRPDKPTCRPISAPSRATAPGDELTLIAADLFGGGVKDPRLIAATFAGSTGDDGDIAWQAAPPRIVWLAPDAAGAGGTITYRYTAASCRGAATGTIAVASR